uniref:Probable serine hydrolase n=1 Tax=Cacopsylla melanoneura TaxID=428564 RepID=A0A8D8XB62_9HEMI
MSVVSVLSVSLSVKVRGVNSRGFNLFTVFAVEHLLNPPLDISELTMGLLTFTEEVQIPMPWGHIRGKLWGSKLSKDKEPIIAMHGWLDNAGTFDHLLPYVTDKVSVLCLDLPGHGLSSHYPRGLRYDSLFDNVVLLRRIMNHFGWKRISLMGHSMGCNISFIFTALYPKDVNYIIALDSIAPLGFETDSEFVDYQADNLLNPRSCTLLHLN